MSRSLTALVGDAGLDVELTDLLREKMGEVADGAARGDFVKRFLAKAIRGLNADAAGVPTVVAPAAGGAPAAAGEAPPPLPPAAVGEAVQQ